MYRRPIRIRFFLSGAACGALLALSACGGGGGGAPTIPAAPATPVASTPTPAAPMPTGLNYDTAEYRRSLGSVQADAIAAYDTGATGKGVTAAIIDSGIDTSNSEFAGRISAASADLVANRGIQDPEGHGTAVASVLGAARNDSGPMGMAFEATLLIARTDNVNSCAGTNGCQHNDNSIARGVDLAVAQGARVINISLGGDASNATLNAAIGRATAAGIVVVIAAGNDGMASPDAFAGVSEITSAAHGLVIVAGALDQNGAIASFSNRAGASASHYLAALGVNVPAYDNTGRQLPYSGTSFAVPEIAGAVALLAQAFPTLTGAQIVQLLYDSAIDRGDAGQDAIYGRGQLSLTRAFQPHGATALAGSATPVSTTLNGTTSAAMGDAAQAGQSAGAVILDGLGRAYALNLGATIARSAPALKLIPALQGGQRSLSMAGGGAVIGVTVAAQGSGATVERLLLSAGEARAARAMAGLATTRLSRTLGVGFGFGHSGATIADQLRGEGGDAFLIAADPLASFGFEQQSGSSMAIRQQLGRFGLVITAEQGDALLADRGPDETVRDRFGRYPYAAIGLAADRRLGALTLRAGLSRLMEKQTVLGARFGPALGGGGATTDFLDLALRLAPGDGWSLGATMRRGWTRAAAGGVALDGGRFASGGFAVDVAKANMFGLGDRLALRLSQPLRVSSGGYTLTLPTGYDYASGVTATSVEALNLAPRGRELDAEASFGVPLLTGWMSASAYWRRDPGHYASLPDDRGGALRFALGF